MEDFGAVATPARGFAASARDVDIYTRARARVHTEIHARTDAHTDAGCRESGTEGERGREKERRKRVELPAARAF